MNGQWAGDKADRTAASRVIAPRGGSAATARKSGVEGQKTGRRRL